MIDSMQKPKQNVLALLLKISSAWMHNNFVTNWAKQAYPIYVNK